MYWAHSARLDQPGDSREGWQRLSDHLQEVRELAARLARADVPRTDRLAADAELCGLLHDYGKYTDAFRRCLTERRGKCQHAIHGAMLSCFGIDGEKPNPTCFRSLGRSLVIMPVCRTNQTLSKAGLRESTGIPASESKRCGKSSNMLVATCRHCEMRCSGSPRRQRPRH